MIKYHSETPEGSGSTGGGREGGWGGARDKGGIQFTLILPAMGSKKQNKTKSSFRELSPWLQKIKDKFLKGFN